MYIGSFVGDADGVQSSRDASVVGRVVGECWAIVIVIMGGVWIVLIEQWVPNNSHQQL